ncbi:hypothetical protein [Halosegnis marinus]|uniref:hypothetical protein n=1 Tax=Halosegnis marinus TaxID=3034023 RepID=UPI003609149D
MTEDNSADGTHTVAQGDVEVTRRLETDGRALIGHVQLRSTAGGPTVVELVDPVPDDVTVESAAFDPDAGPDDGTAGTESIRVEHEVGEDTARVVYGLMLAEPADTAGFEPPRVVRTRPVEPPSPTAARRTGTGRRRSRSATTGRGREVPGPTTIRAARDPTRTAGVRATTGARARPRRARPSTRTCRPATTRTRRRGRAGRTTRTPRRPTTAPPGRPLGASRSGWTD